MSDVDECVIVHDNVGKTEYSLCGNDKKEFINGLNAILNKYKDVEKESLLSESSDPYHFGKIENLSNELENYFGNGKWLDKSVLIDWITFEVEKDDNEIEVTVSTDLDEGEYATGGYWASYI